MHETIARINAAQKFADIIAIVRESYLPETGNEEFLARQGDKREKFLANIYLDAVLLHVIADLHLRTWQNEQELMRTVLHAAKLAYAEYPGGFTYGLGGACDLFGDPWAYDCDTPEVYVAVAFSGRLETDECSCADLSEDDKQAYFAELAEVGIPPEAYAADLHRILWTYDEEESVE